MKKILFISAILLVAVCSYARKSVRVSLVATDTIYYASNHKNVADKSNASYYRVLLTENNGLNKQDLFRDYYLDGTVKAEGGYEFIDLGNDKNTILNGEVTTYYRNGKTKSRGTYENGKPNGYFTMILKDGSVAVAEFKHGVSKHDYFTVTNPDGTMEKHSIKDMKSLLQ